MIFDKWQKEVIETKGSITLRSGRQVGKSTTIGKRTAKLMIKYPGSKSLIIAPAQRQSSELFIKNMYWLMIDHEEALNRAGGYKEDDSVSARRNMELRRLFEKENGIFAEIPTKTMVKLKNGSICYSLPAGKTGTYLRTFALTFLYIDEAAYVPDPVYNALKPMLAVAVKKGLGWECLLSTPYGKGGFFYDSFSDDDYKQFHVSSEDCSRISMDFLGKERKRLTKMEYTQEYLGEFIDEFQQYFGTALIKKCMNFMRWSYKEDYNKKLSYYYGHDYAGPGKDDNASVIAEMQTDNRLKIVEPEVDEEPNTTIVNRKIVFKDEQFKFRKLFVDSGGFGSGPTDDLTNLLGRRVVGLNNAKKSIDHEKEREVRILKEDLYSNAKGMMERGEIDIINDLALFGSLKGMQFEFTESKHLRIYGKKSHLAEAFVRACWSVREKGLEIYLY